MSYDYNLRRLFRPQIDRLPLSEQLSHYHQRDFGSSHLYRLGTGLFGGSGIKTRRRLIDASLYSPPSLLSHKALLKKSVDGRSPPPALVQPQCSANCKSLNFLPTLTTKGKEKCSGNPLESNAENDTKSQYHNWIEERQRIRRNLDGLSSYNCWLLNKERTPMESTLLLSVTNTRRKVSDEEPNTNDLKVTLKCIEKQTEEESKEYEESVVRHKKHVLKEVTLLEQHLVAHRHRLVQMLTLADKLSNKCISVNDMLSIFNKIKIPVSRATTELLLVILTIDDSGLLNYSQLLSGGILRKFEEHFQQHGSELFGEKSSNHVGGTASEDSISSHLQLEKYMYNNPSSMNGKNGVLAGEFKQEELKQFTSLIGYCKENGIVLDWKLAEKALLLPTDHTKKECMQGLRQSGLDLLSCHFADPPSRKSERTKRSVLSYEGWGRPYKELRGRKKADFVRLGTGKVKVQPKIDCWLTFQDYLNLTEQIRSRPGFKYKEHGLPDSSAFWPETIVDKLRLWLPMEILQDKACSQHNIFQTVQHPKASSLLVKQRISWPDNDNGYVQFGGQNKKQYHI